jgi:hypothetical protein
MKREVKISDYEEKQQMLKLALNLVGIAIDYITIDLVVSTLDVIEKKGLKMDLQDAVKIKSFHEEKWENYFKKQQEQ